jgi:hypothetical protein
MSEQPTKREPLVDVRDVFALTGLSMLGAGLYLVAGLGVALAVPGALLFGLAAVK